MSVQYIKKREMGVRKLGGQKYLNTWRTICKFLPLLIPWWNHSVHKEKVNKKRLRQGFERCGLQSFIIWPLMLPLGLGVTHRQHVKCARWHPLHLMCQRGGTATMCSTTLKQPHLMQQSVRGCDAYDSCSTALKHEHVWHPLQIWSAV